MAEMVAGYREDHNKVFQLWHTGKGDFAAIINNGGTLGKVHLPGSFMRLVNHRLSEKLPNEGLAAAVKRYDAAKAANDVEATLQAAEAIRKAMQ